MSKEIFKVNNGSFSFQDQVNVTDLTTEDVASVPKISQVVERCSDEIADQFYNKIMTVPQLKEMIEQHSSIEKLKRTLKIHIQKMFTKDLDDEYLAERNQIALIHYIIKLEPKWYIASFQYLYTIIQSILMREIDDKEEVSYLTSVVSKYISLEMQIVLEAYETKVLSHSEIDDLLQELMVETKSEEE